MAIRDEPQQRAFAPGILFPTALAAAAVLAAAVRLAFLASDSRAMIGGDGYTYHLEALRRADGLGYTSAWATWAPRWPTIRRAG